GEEERVAQRSFADGHGAAERVEDADFNRLGLRGGGHEERACRDGCFLKEWFHNFLSVVFLIFALGFLEQVRSATAKDDAGSAAVEAGGHIRTVPANFRLNLDVRGRLVIQSQRHTVNISSGVGGKSEQSTGAKAGFVLQI